MRLIDIEDTSLLKTIADGRLSAKAVWRLIKTQPTIDAVPVRYGEWIDSHDPWTGGICSACGYQTGERMGHLKLHYRYCHNCGARMDAEREEE